MPVQIPYTDYDKSSIFDTIETEYSRNTGITITDFAQRDPFLPLDEIQKMKKKIEDLMGVPNHLMNTSTAEPIAEVAIVDKTYPITNPAYVRIDTPSEFTYILGDVCNIQKNNAEDLIAELLNTEAERNIYVSRLKDARYHVHVPEKRTLPDWLIEGNVYDPWYRDITSNGVNHFKILRYEPATFQIKVEANSSTDLVIWTYSSTVNKLPISLVIYDIIKKAYTSKKKVNAFMKSISPLSNRISTNYDLDFPST